MAKNCNRWIGLISETSHIAEKYSTIHLYRHSIYRQVLKFPNFPSIFTKYCNTISLPFLEIKTFQNVKIQRITFLPSNRGLWRR